MSSAQIYQVHVVCNGLREPESIIQLVDALDKLDKVFSDVYSSISSRVTKEKSRIDNITSRLNNAQFKVNQIVGSKSAITVFSSAKYPTEKIWPDYQPLYADKPRLPFKPSHYHLHDVGKQENPDNYLEVNDLVFIEKSIDSASKQISVKEGLGHLPSHIPSISNLLLFNTQENPYKKYSNTLDNLQGGGSDEILVLGEVKKKALHAAPITVEKGDTMQQADMVKVNYQPTINPHDLPSYDFPSALPLRAVAENLSWASGEGAGGIAPSNQVSSSLPIYDQQPITQGDAPTQPSYSQAPSTGAPPPPPPPPTTGAPPPPPPPPPKSAPPPPPPPSFGTTDLKDDSDNEQAEDQSTDGSAIGNLLADIRKGHKNRLKKVEKKDDDDDDDTPPPPKPSGGDVMSDLMQALFMRRKSIASTKKKQESESEASDSDTSDWDDR